MQRNDLLVWMDLEMTSLKNVLVDRIIEIAVVLTDKDLNVIAEGPDIVIHADQALFDLNPQVRSLHEESGMLAASLESKITMEEAEKEIVDFLKEHITKQSSPLCGNSIHADRHFLRLQMPAVEDYLFYRCIDVSTLKELAKRWAPNVYEEVKKEKGEGTHRAKDDVLASIAELQFYRKNLFKL